MLIYNKRKNSVFNLDNVLDIKIRYDEYNKIYVISCDCGGIDLFSIYKNCNKDRCIFMLLDILDAYEQGVKVFRI